MSLNKILSWNPEDSQFWTSQGSRIANRNLWVSIPCLFLAFASWMIWSVVAVNLNNIGFNYSAAELFTLAAIPGLTGATLRIFYSFVVPYVGGRRWTALSTLSLLLPTVGIGFAVQDPTTPYSTMLLLAALCGFGGGNFSSSMANISLFFPKKAQGLALGLNAGLGNLGVSAIQLVTPLVISAAVLGGEPQTWMNGDIIKQIWLQNAAFVWCLPILACGILAWFLMDDLPVVKPSLRQQCRIFKNRHTYYTTILYIMSFGSFIGYSAAFPLVIKSQFPDINPLDYAFIGPLLGALIRPIGGWLSDKLGGANITMTSLVVMVAAVLSVIHFLSAENLSFSGFFMSFLVLFAATGVANGSVFRMIGVLFTGLDKGVVLGFTAAVAAYGAFVLPKLFGWSIQASGGIQSALYIFMAYYLGCVLLTWWCYARKNAANPC